MKAIRSNRLSNVFYGDTIAIVVATGLVLFFVGYPILTGIRIFEFDELVRLFRPQHIAPLRNSILLAVLTVPLSLAIGVPLAWLCVRTNLPWRGVIFALVATSFVMPILLTAIAYVFMFGHNSGLINVFFNKHFGIEKVFNAFSFSGVLLVAVFQGFPLIFLTTAAGLANTNPEFEESARVVGLSRWRVFWNIDVGMIRPSIMAGVVFCVAITITMVSGPIVLGVPVGIPFLTSDMYAAVALRPNLARAFAMGLPMVVFTVVAIWIQARFVGNKMSRFAVIGGKGHRANLIELGGWRWPIFAMTLIPVFFSFLLPLAGLVIASLMEFWWKGFVWENLTLLNYKYAFTMSTTRQALVNTVIFASAVGVFLAIAGATLAIIISGRRLWLKELLKGIVTIPLGMPALVVGLLTMLAWFGKPFQLGGSIWILLFGYILIMVPYALRTCSAALTQIDETLPEAGRVVGCNNVQNWRYILFPLMGNGVVATFIIVFLFIVKEFPLTVLSYSVNTQTAMVQLYFLYDEGSFEKSGALAIVVLVVTFLTLGLARRLIKVPLRQFMGS